MTTGPGTSRVSTSETVRGLLAALAARTPNPPECSVTIGTTAKHATKDGGPAARLHTWDVVVRGEDVGECLRKARTVDDGLAAHFAHELETPDNLGAQLAASIVAQEGKKP
jgi:hypothetical protein